MQRHPARCSRFLGAVGACLWPSSRPPQAAFDKVRADKLREVTDGHDGTWVAHPGLIPVARQAFDQHMRQPNQIDSKPRADVRPSQEELLRVGGAAGLASVGGRGGGCLF